MLKGQSQAGEGHLPTYKSRRLLPSLLLRNGVSPGHLFILGHIGVGCEVPEQGLSHPTQSCVYLSASWVTITPFSHSPTLPSREDGGSGGLGAGGTGKVCHSAWLPMGLPCQLNGQMSSWNPRPSPAPELGTERPWPNQKYKTVYSARHDSLNVLVLSPMNISVQEQWICKVRGEGGRGVRGEVWQGKKVWERWRG